MQGEDLTTVLPISPSEGALGGKVPVATLDGKVALTLPGGTQSGQQLRLKGKGLPKDAHSRGDLIVEVRIMVPKTLSARERELFEQLAASSPFNPRENA
jgi:curved DNA-binding protein